MELLSVEKPLGPRSFVCSHVEHDGRRPQVDVH
jgi:hypothetical protein